MGDRWQTAGPGGGFPSTDFISTQVDVGVDRMMSLGRKKEPVGSPVAWWCSQAGRAKQVSLRQEEELRSQSPSTPGLSLSQCVCFPENIPLAFRTGYAKLLRSVPQRVNLCQVSQARSPKDAPQHQHTLFYGVVGVAKIRSRGVYSFGAGSLHLMI